MEAIQFNQELADKRIRLKRLRLRELRQQQATSPVGQQQAGLERPPPFVEQSGITMALEVVPAIGGGVAGAATGNPLLMVGGEVLGAMAGRGLANQARNLENMFRYGDDNQATLANQSLSMLKAGTSELFFSGGVLAVSRAGSKGLTLMGRWTGAHSPEVLKLIDDARNSGINIGAIELKRKFYDIVARVGGVMPIVGGPIRAAREAKGIAISKAFLRNLDAISPAIDLPVLGIKITNRAVKTVRARRAVASAHYDEMYKQFDAAGNPEVIPTNLPRNAEGEAIGIQDIVREHLGALKELPRTSITETQVSPILDAAGRQITSEVTRKGAAVGFPVSPDASFIQALEDFTKLPDFVTPRQLEALQKNLNAAASARSGNKMLANEFRIIKTINAATWDAMDNIPREAGMDPVKSQIQVAKRAWGDLEALIDTAAARMFKRVDANIFRTGFAKPGSAEIDEVADLYLSAQSTLRSPKFIDELEELIGVDNRKALARTILHRSAIPKEGIALPKSGPQEITVFNAAEFRDRLGLADPVKLLGAGALRRNRTTLDRLLQGTGVTSESLDAFLKTAQRVQESPIGDPSVFLTRRIVLSGTPKALIPTGTAGGAAATGFLAKVGGGLSVGVFILSGRSFARLISTPKGLKLLREGYKPNLSRQQLIALRLRLIRAIPDENYEVVEQ